MSKQDSVYVSVARMVRQARALGYRLVERRHEIREAVPAGAPPGLDAAPGQCWEAR